MGLKMRGVSGELKYGYQTVAKFNSWLLSDDRLDAQLVEKNDLWLDSRPLKLVLSVGSRSWVWDEVELYSTEPIALRVIGSPGVR